MSQSSFRSSSMDQVQSYTDEDRSGFLVFIGMLLALAVLWLFSEFAAKDHGALVRTYVTGSGKSRCTHIEIRNETGEHDIAGFRPIHLPRCGTVLIKVPGELYFRPAPGGWDANRAPDWFELGYDGLLWFLMWTSLAGGIWYWCAVTRTGFFDIRRAPSRLVFYGTVPPFATRERGVLHASEILEFERRRRQVKHGFVWDVYALTNGHSRFLLSRPKEHEAQRYIDHLDQWLDHYLGNGRFQPPPRRARVVVTATLKEPGIQFGEVEDAARTSATAICQVCGTRVGHHWISCSRCDTPHHEECWKYAGRCSIYGCGCETPRSDRRKNGTGDATN